MAYPMIDSGVDSSTQGRYRNWQNPTGWSREEATGLYTWIDPVTGDVVQGMQKPMITPGSASSEQTQQPQQQEQPSFLKEANTGIENAWKFEYEKAKREWISAESAYDMGIDVDGSPLPRLGPDTVMRMKEHAYQQFQIKDQELKAHYADLKMKVDQIDKDPYTNEFEKTNAARQLVSPHLPNIPQPRRQMQPKPMPSAAQEALQGIQVIQNLAGNIRRLYKDEYVGPIQGRYRGQVRKFKGIGIDEAEFRQNTNLIGQLLAYAFSGKQISRQEMELLQQAAPNVNLPPESFMSQLAAFENLINMIASQRIQNAQSMGYVVPAQTGGNVPIGLTSDEEAELAELERLEAQP